MNQNKFYLSLVALFVSTLFSVSAVAQTNYVANEKTAKIEVAGTSTLTSWTVKANEIKDYPENLAINLEDGGQIDQFSFGVVVSSMDGGRGAAMNAKVMKALQGAAHPIITYQQSEPAVLKSGEAGNFTLVSKGVLKMAGKERTVEIEAQAQKNDAGALVLKGSKPLKFSDLDIEPPSAMFGQIVCGDEIKINFEFTYQMK
jgi:polyisoprenoid-binding protein YceI